MVKSGITVISPCNLEEEKIDKELTFNNLINVKERVRYPVKKICLNQSLQKK